MALPVVSEGGLAGAGSAPPSLHNENGKEGFFSIDTRCLHSLLAPLQDAHCFTQVRTTTCCHFYRDVRTVVAGHSGHAHRKLPVYQTTLRFRTSSIFTPFRKSSARLDNTQCGQCSRMAVCSGQSPLCKRQSNSNTRRTLTTGRPRILAAPSLLGDSGCRGKANTCKLCIEPACSLHPLS